MEDRSYAMGLANKAEPEKDDGNKAVVALGNIAGIIESRDRCGHKSPEGFEIMVSAAGLEPATHALKGHCSTN
jgi:hypothetical protein